MELREILGASALFLFLVGVAMAMYFGDTAQRKKMLSLSVDLNEEKSASFVVAETIPYDGIDWHLEKKQKTPRSKLDQIIGITRYERVGWKPTRPAGKIVVKVNDKIILKNNLSFAVTSPDTGQTAFYADDVTTGREVQLGRLHPGDIVSVEVSCIETPFDIEVYFSTSKKAEFLGYKQSP